MKFLIIFALAFATVWTKDFYSRSIQAPVLENEGRIANGQKATPAQFYYLAGVYSVLGRKTIWCSGSLIARTWILTAAHCIAGYSLTRVYLGSLQRLDGQKKYDVTGENVIPHPYWNLATLKNDIGLLRIPETPETRQIGLVFIPRNNDDQYLSETVVIAGWGLTHQQSKNFSDDLRYVLLKVSPASVCLDPYTFFYNAQENVCVATPKKESACKGDDGGPLVLHGQNVQIGIFSYGSDKGCEGGHPLVFTRVSAYLDWIKPITKIV